MGNQKNTKNKLSLEKFRIAEIKNSSQIFGGNGEDITCSITKTKDRKGEDQLIP